MAGKGNNGHIIQMLIGKENKDERLELERKGKQLDRETNIMHVRKRESAIMAAVLNSN